MRKIQHLSNYYHTMEPLQLAKALVESSAFFDKVFLCNSGTEANEAALKFARKHALLEAQRKVLGLPADSLEKPAAFSAFGCKAEKPSMCFTRGGSCGCWPQTASNDLAAVLRTDVIAFKGGFHGRSMGSLAATHKPVIRQPFGPFPGDVKFARFNNLSDVERIIGPKTSAIIVEPVQGEGGIFAAEPGAWPPPISCLAHLPPSPVTEAILGTSPHSTPPPLFFVSPLPRAAFMAGLRSLADAHGALLIVDEVQCGLGRSGRLWAHEAYPESRPDMMTLAKPLAGGLPIGAVMMTDAVASCIVPGDHGTTFGGNPLVARAANVVFNRIADPAFLATSRERGAQLLAGMRGLAAKYPRVIKDVRGTLDSGLFVGVDLHVAPKPLVRAALDEGLLIITAGENVLRLCPPLIISSEEIEFGVGVLDRLIPQVFPELAGPAAAKA